MLTVKTAQRFFHVVIKAIISKGGSMKGIHLEVHTNGGLGLVLENPEGSKYEECRVISMLRHLSHRLEEKNEEIPDLMFDLYLDKFGDIKKVA